MLHYQKLYQRMVEGVLVIKKGKEKYGIIRYHSIPTETVYQSA